MDRPLGSFAVREERAGDAPAVRRVNQRAFGGPVEADIVDALRAAGGVTLSLVAEEEGKIVGHILFSPVTIESAAGTVAAVGLGPMAVLPERQGEGIGSSLVREGLSRLRRSGHATVVVLGHPGYYPRFGFVPASQFRLRWEMECPDEAFMALELRPGALSGRGGVVCYRPEFGVASGGEAGHQQGVEAWVLGTGWSCTAMTQSRTDLHRFVAARADALWGGKWNELAEAAGVSHSVVADIRSGRSPEPATLRQLARPLRCTVVELYLAAGYLTQEDLAAYGQALRGTGWRQRKRDS